MLPPLGNRWPYWRVDMYPRRKLLLAMLAFWSGVVIWLQPTPQINATLIFIAGITMLYLLIREPVLGLCFTLICAPFKPLEQELYRYPIDSGQALLILTLLSYGLRDMVMQPLHNRTGQHKLRANAWVLGAIGLFGFVAITSFFQARDGVAWLRECLKWVEIIIIYLIVANESRAKRLWVMIAILGCGVFQGGLGLLQFTRNSVAPDHFAILGGQYFRAFGTLQQPNPFGGLMGLIWPFAIGVAVWALSQVRLTLTDLHLCLQTITHHPEKGKALRQVVSILNNKTKPARPQLALAGFAFLVAILSLAGLIASWSRGAWLAAGVAFVAMLIVAFRRPGRTLVIIAVFAAMIYLFNGINYLPASLRDRLTGFTSQYSSLDIDVRYVVLNPTNFATIERLAHWQAAQEMIQRYTWFGVGFGNYEAAYDEVRTMYWRNALGHAHNYYLNIFAETGVVGFSAYLVMWLCLIIYTALAKRRNLLAIGIIGAWGHITAHNFVDNVYVANLFLLMGAYLGFLEPIPDDTQIQSPNGILPT